MKPEVRVGDVLCTRTQHGLGGLLIRLGAALRDQPNTVNHVAIVHHRDRQGRLWGIEGRPGGVGWVELGHYLASPWTISNADQPKTSRQRMRVARALESALGRPYDWQGIALDAVDLVTHLYDDWTPGKAAPGHVVCSSLAAWAYDHVELPAPGNHHDRTTTPADWAEWIITQQWKG